MRCRLCRPPAGWGQRGSWGGVTRRSWSLGPSNLGKGFHKDWLLKASGERFLIGGDF